MATKETRRLRGSGGLYQRASDNMWVAAINLPAIGGKRRRKVIVRAKREDAVKALRKMRLDLDKHGDLKGSSPTLTVWCEDWMKRYGRKRKPTNWERDQSTIDRYIVPPLGKVKLDALAVRHIHQMHDYVTAPKPDGLGLSPTTANLAHRLLSTILEAAYGEEKVTRNVAKVAGAPAVAIVNKDHLTSAQVRQLLMSLDPGDGTVPTDLALMALSYFTGMRPAERLALPDDLVRFTGGELDSGTIAVAWQLQRIKFVHGCGPKAADGWPCGRKKGGYCPKRLETVPANVEAHRVEGGLWLTRPKTKASRREFPMVGILSQTLRAYRETHEPGMHGLLFTRPQGGKGKGALIGRPIDPSAYTERWTELLKGAGLPNVSPHSARHSANTILTELGVPVDVRIKILGHAGAAVNEGIYTHTSDVRVREAMEAISRELDWRR